MNPRSKTILIILATLIVGLGAYLLLKGGPSALNYNASQANFNTNEANLNTAPTANTNAQPEEVSACQDSNLTAGLSGGNGAAGTYYYTLTVTNKGSIRCSITGSPKLVALSSTGTALGQATASTQSTASFVIGNNESVYASVGFPNSTNFSSGTCKPMKTLIVYTAGDTAGITIPNIDQLSADYTSKYCHPFNVSSFSSKIQ